MIWQPFSINQSTRRTFPTNSGTLMRTPTKPNKCCGSPNRHYRKKWRMEKFNTQCKFFIQAGKTYHMLNWSPCPEQPGIRCICPDPPPNTHFVSGGTSSCMRITPPTRLKASRQDLQQVSRRSSSRPRCRISRPRARHRTRATRIAHQLRSDIGRKCRKGAERVYRERKGAAHLQAVRTDDHCTGWSPHR